MEIQSSNDICCKHCPRKFENLTGAESCPFNLIEWSIETESDKSTLNTHCSRMGSYLEEIIIKRVIDITAGAVKLIRETITQKKIPIVDNKEWINTPIGYPGDVITPMYPNGENIPIYPNTSFGTDSLSQSMNKSGGTKSDI